LTEEELKKLKELLKTERMVDHDTIETEKG
jgi:hypothetical protein